MTYHFNNVVNRRQTKSVKWDTMESVYNIKDASNVLPMWIADMDFKAPQPVIEALERCVEHGVFGYSYLDESCKNAIQSWLEKRHHWYIEKEWVIAHSGVVPAIASIIETFTKPDDRVLITPPVYPPFSNLPSGMDRELVVCSLIEEHGNYSIDFEDFEEKLKQGITMFILCNPHNPGGVVWSTATLEKIIELCVKYDVLILSDEIHSDLVFPEYQHIPLGKLASDQASQKIITCTAPTKTFNLAGIHAALIISPNQAIRHALETNFTAHGLGVNRISPFGAAALEAAYTYGENWLDELLHIISSNMDYAIAEITKAIPQIKIKKPQATYLLWIDYRQTGLTESEIMDKLLEKGKLALEPGTKYGEEGRGFLRMNVACAPSTVKDGVERFISALQ
ncbi:pyridoxal phosphate-dependent aminotransferase [Staphylococcus nepalensis]|uniref:cysteine-S-conjugate beta-lyase n=1 Tax=Staphylococcus nepalensis TaxID=214473 RepID=A0ABS3L154_9STAP|nr:MULTISPECIES: MalY/PatB family protein [Staphylococcus]ATH59059.1 Fis family transcriptional regulator [Staphylococcus nepalensis]ATH64149.1 Fis family transcriptional regulator [Staphylococcus nepalensis]AWI43511.1 Fis family transcriptional regulator [Staphylococcus nepalensis]MBO1212372.1 pyridoxal phosphate-dependent aminotransferase [Staphylococcus nepalensis]MBO1216184.1 pyridoxal phosphate-dependent aminotransferase [Staphylococcus nepalensis]